MTSNCRIHLVLFFALSVFFAGHSSAADRKPNFLFIYTDDHRWDAMGVVQREQGERARFPWFKSPGMDRLAAEGVRFRNAFVTLSLCAPSRAAFLTGRYNHLNGITNNGTPFPAESVTHATLLRTAGYQTAYIGKWHMGEQRGQRPGFDYSASFIGQGSYQNCPFEINGVSTPTNGWVDDVSTDYAIEWIKQNKERPFSMVVGFKSPHNPRGGKNLPERLRDLYAGETSRPTPNCGVPAIFHKPGPGGKHPTGLADNAIHLDYLRHVRGVDENVSRMLDALDALGLTEDTVVVYSSDNGFYLGEHCSGDKRSLYDESMRIPLLVRYPRLFGKGLVVDDLALNIDLAPTFLDLAGVAVPREMQGASWKELASGRKSAGWRQSFFAEYYKELGDVPTCFAIRTTTHKLIKYPNLPEFTEVFDLTADPYEIKNLVSDTALTSKLDADLGQLMKTVSYTAPSNANQARQPVPTKPNVIIILADDLGYGDVQCYNRERGKIATPHLDRLASQGMRFTDAHTSSGVCSPTRYSLLTGRYHWRSRLQQGIVDYLGSPLIPPGRLTLAGLLKQHGYRTGIIGKWHLGWNMQLTDEERKLLKSYGGKPGGGRQVTGVATDEDRTAWRTIYSRQLRGGPVTLGFDSYFGTDVPNWPPYCFIENDRTMGIPSELLAADALRKNQASFQGPALADWKLENVLPTLGDRACAFIEDAAKKPEPFFLYLPLTAPHTPIAVAEQWRGKSGLNDYADFVMQTDATVARVLESLEKSGAADKTLVIFTSDNGCAPYAGVKDQEAKGHFPSGPLRGYKADAWEGGHRVPFIVRWPGIVKPATRCDALVQQTDIMATLAETLGAKLPANVGEDSVSLMPLLKGSDKPTREYAVSHASSGLPALRKGSWKIIFGQMGGGFGGAPGVAESGQLYDLAADLGETKNLWLDKPELVAELTATMTRLVTEGRSTPGAKQQNDVPVRWQRFLRSSSPAQ